MFPLDGKIKLSVARVSANGRKKMVSTSQKIRFPLAGMKNLFKNTFLLDEKTAYIGRNI